MSEIRETDDLELIYQFSRANSLAEKPGKNNWIEKTSDEGLPDYISRIAKALIRSGKSKSTAIAIAISRVKAWAAGGDDVDPDTRAKASAALAAWEKLKASNKARSKKIAMSNSMGIVEQVASPYELLALSVNYSMDSIKAQYEQMVRDARNARRAVSGKYEETPYDYMWIKEVWTNYVIAKSDHGSGAKCYRVDYTVDKHGKATFGIPVEVMTKYVTVKQLAESEGEYANLSAQEFNEWLIRSEQAAILRKTTNVEKFSESLVK